MKLIAFISFCIASFAISEACTCMPMPEPAVCQTEYLMLVKITGANDDSFNMVRTYTFNLIKDISYPAPFTRTFALFETSLDFGMCRIDLNINSHYLIGGKVMANGRLSVRYCESYVQRWNIIPCNPQNDPQLTAIQQVCREYRESSSTSTTSTTSISPDE